MRDFSALNLPTSGQAAERAKARLHYGRRLRPNRAAELMAAAGITVFLTVCGAVFICSGILSTNKLHNNIYVDGVAVGGLTEAEALSRFAALQSSIPAALQVTIDGKTWKINPEDISSSYSVTETVEEAYDVGRKGNVLQNLGDILSLRSTPRNFSFAIKYDKDKLDAVAATIAKEASTPPHDAALQFQPDTESIFTITAEVSGKSIDAKELTAQLVTTLGNSVPTSVSMQSKTALPGITAAKLKAQTQLLGSFTTALTPDAVRNKNIGLSGAAANGAVIFPGDTLSFNALTGERTIEKGYVDAPTISGNQLVDAPGGGVCQVSSTIYNAALLSGLEIVERHNHTWPMSYVDVGMDATVDFASKKDLRLKNNTDAPVYLILKVDTTKRLVTADFYGIPSLEAISVESEGYQVVMPDKPLEFSNDDKPIGWSRTIVQARSGYRVTINRVFTRGKDSRKELVSEDYYPPVQGQIEIGMKAPPGKGK